MLSNNQNNWHFAHINELFGGKVLIILIIWKVEKEVGY